ncbi:MAG: thermosome subunit beta, partial [Candidatus Woesearchaeota archaeon]
AEANKEKLADLIVKAVKGVAQGNQVDIENVKVEKRTGSSTDQSELVEGILLDKEKVHPSMPELVKEARIALLDCALEIKNTEIDAKIQITDPNQLQAFLDSEEKTLRDMVEKIKDSTANVVICQKGIDDLAQHFMAKANIFAIRRVKKSDMEALAKATGGKIVSSLKELNSTDLGEAGLVREEKIGDEEMVFVERCKNPKAMTLLVRGGTEHVVEEIKRAVEDGIKDIAVTLREGKAVGGAGAPEMRLVIGLKKFSAGLEGREQLAVNAFAEAMEVIPRTLAENAGLDPIDVLTKLRAGTHKWNGVNVFTGEVIDSWKEGVIEPLKIKTQAISSAAEVAEMILRIDDVVMGGKGEGRSMPPGGMGGMQGMM